MSFDLSFWHEDVQSTPERAAGFYDRIADGEDRVVPSVPAIGDFAAEAIALFGDLTEENIEASPWTSPLYRTSECVIANIAYSRSEAVAPVLRRLASKHGLTTYDPQNREVHPPTGS